MNSFSSSMMGWSLESDTSHNLQLLDDHLGFAQYGVMRHVVPQLNACATTPLTEPVLLILLGLSDKPRHGYAVLKDIEVLTNGRVGLSTGTLYGALRRLSRNKWIERFEQGDKSRDKQAYKLTPAGQRQLKLELSRMNELLQVASMRHVGRHKKIG
jgi:DNA-binding PadR family transcriptional regulator